MIVNNKTGFKAIGKVRIYKNGRPFLVANGNTFNLPEGKYKVDGNVIELKQPVKYRLKTLPKPEKKHVIENKNYHFVFTFVPTKAQIIITDENCYIALDTSFKQYGEMVCKWLTLHEFAHLKYKKENYCDNYAFNEMIKEGYNPSQLSAIGKMTLKGHDRINYIDRLSKKAI